MKKKIIVVLSAIISIGFASITSAASTKDVTGTITKVQFQGENYESYNTSGKALAFIYMDELPVACDNSNDFRRVAITSDHPAFNAVVSTVLAAKAAGQSIKMRYVEECTLWNSNAWDFSIITVG